MMLHQYRTKSILIQDPTLKKKIEKEEGRNKLKIKLKVVGFVHALPRAYLSWNIHLGSKPFFTLIDKINQLSFMLTLALLCNSAVPDWNKDTAGYKVSFSFHRFKLTNEVNQNHFLVVFNNQCVSSYTSLKPGGCLTWKHGLYRKFVWIMWAVSHFLV